MSEKTSLFFEDVGVGDEIGPLMKRPTLEQVKTFCRAYDVEDPNRFTDLETAKKEGVPHLIIPGVMSMAYLSQLITGWAPNVILKKLDVIFRGPVRHEIAIQCKGLVTDKIERDGEKLLECDVYIEDAEQGNRYVTGSAIVAVPSRK